MFGDYVMPKIDGAEYILQHLQNIGFYSNNGMGIVPISYVEIEAYSRLTGLEFTETEISVMKKMSIAYVNQSYDKGMNSKPPYVDGNMVKVNNNSESIKNAFAGLCTIQKWYNSNKKEIYEKGFSTTLKFTNKFRKC